MWRCPGARCELPGVAEAQIVGSFYLEKQSFAPGEPVFLYFRIPATSPLASTLPAGYGDQPMCSGVEIHVSNDKPMSTASCSLSPESLCVMNGRAMDSSATPQGQTITKRFILNFQHKLDVPGSYWVYAERKERIGAALVTSHAKLYFRIDGNLPTYSAEKLQAWVKQLKSPDVETRLEAARVLASIAPVQMEPMFVEFTHSEEFAQYAPLAFARLHDQTSLIALANIIRNRPFGSFESLEAARYLAEEGGKYWSPVLLGVATQHYGYLAYAAEAGGDAVLPDLQSFVPNPSRHLEAIEALGWTGSRKAVPILLELLESTDRDTSSRAEWALRILTHRISSGDAADPHKRYVQWSEWWRSEGATTVIFKPGDCGRERPLKGDQSIKNDAAP